jgi:5-methyltetrahydrofolate--homocysteine methyltransferase
MDHREQLDSVASRRILILDGAMGSLIQQLKFSEEDFRGVPALPVVSGDDIEIGEIEIEEPEELCEYLEEDEPAQPVVSAAASREISAEKNSGKAEDAPKNRFADHPIPLKGCNDLLCLTKPDAISAIHEAYLEAGADIIETNSFNSTAISLADYGIGDLAYEISLAAASLARKAADKYSSPEKPRFVAGSMGPTAKSASLSPDMNDPAKRGVSWEELEAAYYDNARGLLDGGADLILVETVFDTLNAKAALFAVNRLLEERGGAALPVMISATVSGEGGRLLSGQTLEAFCVSVLHARPWSIGLNCSFGAEKLLPHLRELSGLAPCFVSVHPNAGMPNQLGGYDETPETMGGHVKKYLEEGLVNIIGGCCGTTPEHIAVIAALAASCKPRTVPACAGAVSGGSRLAGLETLKIGGPGTRKTKNAGFVKIGERTNVSGCRLFLRLVNEKKYDEALGIVRDMIAAGASIINVGMDDALLDAEKEMCAFLNLALSDPGIAALPFMIDSSRWNVIEAGLKCVQGKSLVNSINLKDGEAEFLRRAELLRCYGAAVVVMLIDEQGQAASYERKTEIAGRAYSLLRNADFPAEDIVFDPNVLAAATGISEHGDYARDTIRACSWIRDNCPGVQISGGISNLSFSFRGNNTVREAMHSVFLKHAVEAGMSMAIVNPAALVPCDDIETGLREAVEDVILNRRPDATERLLSLAEKIAAEDSARLDSVCKSGAKKKAAGSGETKAADWRKLDTSARIRHAMVKGLDDYIEADVLELQKTCPNPLKIVEGPLMDGMKEVGDLFGRGKMYLPQVIRSARVMKKAVAVLEPSIQKGKTLSAGPKILLATVKGDVHDIGKGIVGVILGCNGCDIIDLGVMIPAEQILEAAEKQKVSMIGLSGLISPSLDEMVIVAGEMEKRKMRIPLLIGGAAASLAHTSLRIAPEYSGPVIYVPDAATAAETVRTLASDDERPRFLEETEEKYLKAASRHKEIQSRIEILPLETARANKIPTVSYIPVKSKTIGIVELNEYPVDRVIPYIDWNTYFRTWELADKTYPKALHTTVKKKAFHALQQKLLEDARAILDLIKTRGLLKLRGVIGIFPAASFGDDVALYNPDDKSTEIARFCFLRSQEKKRSGAFNACLADFIAPAGSGTQSGNAGPADYLGLFALSAGFGLREGVHEYQALNDDYNAIVLATLANTLAEAFTEEIHLRLRREWWGYSPDENLSIEDILKGKYVGIRPAFGYPICPDHGDKQIVFEVLEAHRRCGLDLSSSSMMIPAASSCGMFIANPFSYYFGIGQVAEDQIRDWARRKGLGIEEARRRIGNLNTYCF